MMPTPTPTVSTVAALSILRLPGVNSSFRRVQSPLRRMSHATSVRTPITLMSSNLSACSSTDSAAMLP